MSTHPLSPPDCLFCLNSVHLVVITFHENDLCSRIKLHPHRPCYFSFTKTCWINRFYLPPPSPWCSLISVSRDLCWPLECINFNPDTCCVSSKLSPQLTEPDCWPLLLRALGVQKAIQTSMTSYEIQTGKNHHAKSNAFVGFNIPWARPSSG